MKIVIDISKQRIKKIKQSLGCILGIAFFLSLIFSLFNTAENRPCETYGYYLPMTFIMCNLNETRKGLEK